MEKKIKTVGVITKYDYTGKLGVIQLYGNLYKDKKYYDANCPLTDYQSFLYNRALFGLSVYSQAEIRIMNWEKRKRIVKVHKRAQTVLNLWKQEVINNFTNVLISKLFTNISAAKERSAKNIAAFLDPFTDATYTNTLSFRELGISKEEIIKKLITEGVLPKEFYTLKEELSLA